MPTEPSRIRKLLDHRPHRPRQVARSPIASSTLTGALTDREQTRAVPRQDGHRARARHHDQGSDRPPETTQRRTAQTYRLQPHRHTWPRRLQLRGLAQPARRARARCSSSTRHRAPRRRRWRTSYLALDQQPPRSCRSSTRSTSPPRDVDRAEEQIEEVIGLDRQRCRCPWQRQDGRRACRTSSKRSSRAHPAAEGATRTPAPRPHLRHLVRQLPRRGGHGARRSRAAS